MLSITIEIVTVIHHGEERKTVDIRDHVSHRCLRPSTERGPEAQASYPMEDGLQLDFITDVFSGALPTFGLFAHAENMESLVSYPLGNVVYLQKGGANVKTCQAGVWANLMGTVALTGAGILTGVGLAAAAVPVTGLGVAALMMSGAINAFTRREIDRASGSSVTVVLTTTS